MTQQAQAEALQTQQFLIARRSHLGSRKSMCDDNGKAAWDKYTAAADLIARQAGRIAELEAQQTAPQFYAAFGSSGAALPQYSASTEEGVIFNVLSVARNEGFKGSGLDRLIELGWVVRPVFRAPTPPALERKPLTDEQINALWGGENVSVPQLVNRRAISRSIERAHGIGATNG